MADHERSSTKHQRYSHLGQSGNVERSGKSAHLRSKNWFCVRSTSFHVFPGPPTRTRLTCTFFLRFFIFFPYWHLRSRFHISSEDRHFDSHKFVNRSDRDDSYDYSHGSPIRTAREERAPQLDRGRRSRRYSESEVSKCMTTIVIKLKITVHTIIGPALGFSYERSSLDFTWSS